MKKLLHQMGNSYSYIIMIKITKVIDKNNILKREIFKSFSFFICKNFNNFKVKFLKFLKFKKILKKVLHCETLWCKIISKWRKVEESGRPLEMR